jgi:hypothetical protein
VSSNGSERAVPGDDFAARPSNQAPRGTVALRARLAFLACLVGGLALPARADAAPTHGDPAGQASATELADRVQEMLAAGIETSAPSVAFADMGAAGTRALISVYERPDAPRHVRLRALAALGGLHDPVAVDYLLGLLAMAGSDASRPVSLGELHPARSPAALHRVLAGLVHAKVAVSAELARPCLEHRDPVVRAEAVRLLAFNRRADVGRLFEEQRKIEGSPRVQRALDQALKDRSVRP